MDDKILFLQSEDELKPFWPEIKPMLQKCVTKAVHGEYEVDDIYQLVKEQRGFVIYVFWGGKPSVALAVEWVFYPRMKAVNIMALGGKHLIPSAEVFWTRILNMLKSVGIEYVECSCSEAMARMLTSKLNFQRTYEFLRLKL